MTMPFFNGALEKVRRWMDPAPSGADQALVLSGGGARSSYQAGVLHYIGDAFPGVNFSILHGVSAGAINAAQLANHAGPFSSSAAHLVESWRRVRTERVFEPTSSFSFVRGLFRRRNGQGEDDVAEGAVRHGFVDTAPLRAYLDERLEAENGQLIGISRKLRGGRLKAVAISTTNYSTGQTETWVQGANIEHWERPNRISTSTTLSVDHVMASCSLPLLFPAVRLGDAWYGDGGIRLAAPLSPAINLGADRILVISTRYGRTRDEADRPTIHGYPPAAQVIGILMNAIFLDVLDQDAIVVQHLNTLLEQLPPRKRMGMRPIQLLLLRPSVDIGKLSSQFDTRMPKGALRLLTFGLGTRETESPDWLSMLLFDPDYIARLLEIGYEDARRQHDALAGFFEGRQEAVQGISFPRHPMAGLF